MAIHKDDLSRLMTMDRRQFMAATAAASGSLALGGLPARAAQPYEDERRQLPGCIPMNEPRRARSRRWLS